MSVWIKGIILFCIGVLLSYAFSTFLDLDLAILSSVIVVAFTGNKLLKPNRKL